MRWHYIPNLITCFRILLIGPICYYTLQHHYLSALIYLIIAGISDSIDGFLARHFAWQTRLGSFLDPAADKLLIVCCFSAFAWIKAIPLWLLIIILLKDITVVTGAAIYHYLIGPYEFAATWISKTNTFLQILFLLVILLKLQFAKFPTVMVKGLMITVLVTTLLSMLNYVWIWGSMAYQQTKH